MADLAQWMRSRLDRHDMTQAAASVDAGVGRATSGDILNKGHVPKCEILFRLAETCGIDGVAMLRPKVSDVRSPLPSPGMHDQ